MQWLEEILENSLRISKELVGKLFMAVIWEILELRYYAFIPETNNNFMSHDFSTSCTDYIYMHIHTEYVCTYITSKSIHKFVEKHIAIS